VREKAGSQRGRGEKPKREMTKSRKDQIFSIEIGNRTAESAAPILSTSFRGREKKIRGGKAEGEKGEQEGGRVFEGNPG